jgi:hypothetical protein
MKKCVLVSFTILLSIACNKTKYSPEGPTDIRVKNSTGKNLTEVIIDTSAGKDTLGNISAGSFSEYFRFEKAFPKAEISAKIDGDLFSTGTVDYNGLTYIGQAKITYEVIILNPSDRTLKILDCSLDAPLD